MTKLTLKLASSKITQDKITALIHDTMQQTPKQIGEAFTKNQKPQQSFIKTQSSLQTTIEITKEDATTTKQKAAKLQNQQSTTMPKRSSFTREQQAIFKESTSKVQTWLMETYPAVFNTDTPKPLKRHVCADLRLQCPNSVTDHQLKAVLRAWTGRRIYLENILNHDQRYDLQGDTVEDIRPEHKEYARKQLTILQQRFAEQQRRKLFRNLGDKPMDNVAITTQCSIQP